jgi:hypothetical protein
LDLRGKILPKYIEDYTLDVVDAKRKVILKEIVVLYCAKYISDNMKIINIKISIGFFCLQGKPALLVPWMVFVIVFMIANTILYIIYAAQEFSAKNATNGTGNIIAALVYLCK